MTGLPDSIWPLLTSCFARYPEIKWVKLYGSRALGTYKSGSDIDLAYSATRDCSAALAAALDELSTPYLFDVTHYESISNPNLKDHVDRVGQIIYQRKA